MLSSLLLAGLAAIWAGPDDAKDAVARLVSPKAAERDAAEKALADLGEAAVPALNEAMASNDLELRNRAAALLDAFDGRALMRPTMVHLNYQARPIGEVAAAIGREAGISVILEPEDGPRVRDRPITLKADGPLPLWDAIDRFGRAAGLRLDPNSALWARQRQQMMMFNGPARRKRVYTGAEWVFRPDDGTPNAPASDEGAVRVTIVSLLVDRSVSFLRTPEMPSGAPSTSQFTIGLQVRAEPKLTIASVEGPHLTEARDEKGRSLLPDTPPPNAPRPPVDFANGPQRQAPLSASLKLPDDPGRSIALLRGTVRLLMVGRGGDPLRIPFEGSVGKTFTAGSVGITLQAVRPGNDAREATVEMAFDRGGPGGAAPMYNAIDPRAGLRSPPAAWGQLEFYDAQGHLCQAIDLATSGMGMGMANPQRFQIQPPEGAGPPTEVRYYPSTWATLDVPFVFRDVPMP